MNDEKFNQITTVENGLTVLKEMTQALEFNIDLASRLHKRNIKIEDTIQAMVKFCSLLEGILMRVELLAKEQSK